MALGIKNQLRQELCCQGAFRPEEPKDKVICYHTKCSKFCNRANPERHGSTVEGILAKRKRKGLLEEGVLELNLSLRTLLSEAKITKQHWHRPFLK